MSGVRKQQARERKLIVIKTSNSFPKLEYFVGCRGVEGGVISFMQGGVYFDTLI